MTQEALTEKVGKSTVYISMLEGGHRAPSLELLFALAKAMGVDQGELIREHWSGPEACAATSSQARGRRRLKR